jgi:RND superfamily putative drug exporter
MSVHLYRLARWSLRNRWKVLAGWLVAVVAAVVIAGASGGKTSNDFTIPGTEAQQAQTLLFDKVPVVAGGQTQVVFADPDGAGLNGPTARAAVREVVARLKTVPQAVSATDPYQARQVSANGRIAQSTVQFSVKAADVSTASLDAVRQAVKPATSAGIQVDYTGSVYPGWQSTQSELPELVGLLVALVILLITFGSFTAAGLPILTAIIGVGVTMMAVTAVASVVDIASAATTVALMLGLSCGIDYGLFVLFRHRNNLLAGMDVEESVGMAMGTAGGSVVFAGLTVIVALCGLSIVGIPFLTAMGLSAAAAVLVALLIALTLLPAVLGFAGHKVISFFSLPPRSGRQKRTASRSANHPDQTWGSAWARFVVRARVPVLIGGVALLGLIALPATRMELGLPSGGAKPTSDTQRKAYDLLSEGFGPGYNGALLVVADGAPTAAAAQPVASRIARVPGVASATVGIAENDVAVLRVIPTTGPNDEATDHLVHQLRQERTALTSGTGAHILIGGTTASNIDVSAKLSSALPEFLIVVIGLAFLLLTFAFRTILVPIKSILGFLLSVAAAFGAQVAMFQWGWGQHLLGITPTQTVSFLPILMLAIIFGLSSDYEVFVVSRVQEDFSKTGDAHGSVIRGTANAARVVTSAALIMFTIFVSFMFAKDPTVKDIGFSFAIGVFLDAFVVRLTLVPAVMAIAGSRIWYHPRWFARHVPDPDIEGRRLDDLIQIPEPTGEPTPAAGG